MDIYIYSTSHILLLKPFYIPIDDVCSTLEVPKVVEIVSNGDKLDPDRPIGERQSPDGQEEESDSNTTVKTLGL